MPTRFTRRGGIYTAVLVLSLILIMGAVFFRVAYAQWSEPTAPPTGNNTNPPLDTSSTSQNKTGALTVGSTTNYTAVGMYAPIYYDANNTSYYLQPSNTGTSAVFAGSVGIGTTSPAAQLDVNGNIAVDTNFSWGKQATANGNPEDSLYFTTTFNGGSSVNDYTYYKIDAPSYVIQSGDYLEYDIYCSPNNVNGICDGGVELGFTNGAVGRNYSPSDQNGIGWFGDHGAYSKGRWYHRKFNLASMVGLTLNDVDVVEEANVTGTLSYYYRNIEITNNNIQQLVIWNGGNPSVNAPDYTNYATAYSVGGSYFAGGYFAGNVGIGTTAPLIQLQVGSNGGIYNDGSTEMFSKNLYYNNAWDYIANGFASGILADSSGNVHFYTAPSGTANTTAALTDDMTILNNGNVGIGVGNPADKLTIAGTSYPTSFTGIGSTVGITGGIPTNGFAKLTFGNGAGGDYGGIGLLVTNSGSYLYFGTSNNYASGITNNAMVIDYNGNVGIGTTSPGYKLEVNGDILADGWLRTSGNTGWYSQTYGSGFYMTDSSWIRSYGAAGLWFNSGLIGTNGGLTIGYGGSSSPSGGAIIAGNVGIGTASPDQLLTVSGIIHSTSGGFEFPDGTVLTSALPTASCTNISGGNSGALASGGSYSVTSVSVATSSTKTLISTFSDADWYYNGSSFAYYITYLCGASGGCIVGNYNYANIGYSTGSNNGGVHMSRIYPNMPADTYTMYFEVGAPYGGTIGWDIGSLCLSTMD